MNEDSVLSAQLVATDPDGDALTFSKSGEPSHGTLTISAAGAVTYSPALNYNGTDQFMVNVMDGRGGSATGTVSISIRAVNDAPTFGQLAYAGDEDTAITGRLSVGDVDGDTYTLALAGAATNGVVTLQAGGDFVLQPPRDFVGTATFGVTATDTGGASATQTISVTVRPINDPPIARDDRVRLAAGSGPLPLLVNDTDVDGDVLTVSILSQPRGGTVAVANGNQVTFQRENGFAGPATLTYRVTDAAGVTADASVSLVVGEFPGVVFTSDETTIGTRELFLYDGFQTTRVNAPLPAGGRIDAFAIAPDGRHLAYIVTGTNDQVFVGDLEQPGSGRLIYQSLAPSSFEGTRVTLNRDGSFAFIADQSLTSALKTLLVRTADGAQTLLGASNSELGGGGFYTVFNPVTDEFYLQAQVGGTRQMLGSGYTTLYGGSTNAPDPLRRLGATYVPDRSNGSGYLPVVTADGQRVMHIETIYSSPNPNTIVNVLVNTPSANSETFASRPTTAYEWEFPLAFGLSSDGTRLCYILRVDPLHSSDTRVWFSDLTMPVNGTPATPATQSNFGCEWAVDNRTILYESLVDGAYEMWVRDTSSFNGPRRLREPLAPGEQLDYRAMARRSTTVVVGVRPPGTVIPDFYRAAIDNPGTSVKFASGSFIPSGDRSRLKMNAMGTLLAYGKGNDNGANPRVPRLHLLSTQTLDYDLQISRQDATMGVYQFEFVPRP